MVLGRRRVTLFVMSLDEETFDFEYIGLKHFEPEKGFAIFGRLHSGSIRVGVPIAVPSADGNPVIGTVGHFQETFYDWVGLPFYHTVTPDPTPFAIFIGSRTQASQSN